MGKAFFDDSDLGGFKDMERGHHRVTVRLLEKDGEPWIVDGPRGPKAMLQLKNETGATMILRQPFNLKSKGVVHGILYALGIPGVVASPVAEPDAWTETSCPHGVVAALCNLMETSEGGWVLVYPQESDNRYNNVKFLDSEPAEKLDATAFPAPDPRG